MSLFERALGAVGLQRKTSSLDLFRDVFGGTAAKSGVIVNWQTALQVTTVLACCRVIAEGVAQVPWKVYRDTDGGRELATEHPLFDLIECKPNSWQTSFEFREAILFHTILTGNAFVFLNKVGSDRRVAELIPIEPGRVEVKQNDDFSLIYKVRGKHGEVQEFPQDVIWHLRGPSWNSWTGMDGVKLARDAIGLSISTEQTHAEFHKNGTRTAGSYSVDGPLSPEQHKMLTAWLKEHAQGGDNAWAPLVLDRGAKWLSNQMTGVDAQHIETRKHQIEEMCRAFRVLPIMVMHADKTATYASAEQMFIAHVVHTLGPWYKRLEDSAKVGLLSEADRKAGFYTKFTPNALMRGAAKDRAEFYAKALGSGGSAAWLTQNEIRGLEEFDGIGALGDILHGPAIGPEQPNDDETDDK